MNKTLFLIGFALMTHNASATNLCFKSAGIDMRPKTGTSIDADYAYSDRWDSDNSVRGIALCIPVASSDVTGTYDIPPIAPSGTYTACAYRIVWPFVSNWTVTDAGNNCIRQATTNYDSGSCAADFPYLSNFSFPIQYDL